MHGEPSSIEYVRTSEGTLRHKIRLREVTESSLGVPESSLGTSGHRHAERRHRPRSERAGSQRVPCLPAPGGGQRVPGTVQIMEPQPGCTDTRYVLTPLHQRADVSRPIGPPRSVVNTNASARDATKSRRCATSSYPMWRPDRPTETAVEPDSSRLPVSCPTSLSGRAEAALIQLTYLSHPTALRLGSCRGDR